jgi:hypothetical protein
MQLLILAVPTLLAGLIAAPLALLAWTNERHQLFRSDVHQVIDAGTVLLQAR